MSTVAVLGLVWALVGVPLIVRVFQERRPLPMEEFQRAMGALQTQVGVPGSSVRTAQRRRLVSTLTYAPGLGLLVVGLAVGDSAVLAVALALVNLGTAHRLVALAVDRSARLRPPAPGSSGVPSPGLQATESSGAVSPGLPANGLHAVDPRVDEPAGDAHAWGDGWQIIRPEPRRVDDLVLVDADLA
jgi:hypothetical protein